MDRRQAELTAACVREAVRLARRAHHDVAALDDDGLVADLERRLPGLDHEYLGVRVPMQLRADTGPRVHEDDRERDVAVLGTDEFVRVLGVRQVVELDDRAMVLGQQSLAPFGETPQLDGPVTGP